MKSNNIITKNKIKYRRSSISNSIENFTWDWDEHCKVQPDSELVYEDKTGQEYVIYIKNDNIVGEFLNKD